MTELMARHAKVMFIDLKVSGLVKMYEKNPKHRIFISLITKKVNIVELLIELPTVVINELLQRVRLRHIHPINCKM